MICPSCSTEMRVHERSTGRLPDSPFYDSCAPAVEHRYEQYRCQRCRISIDVRRTVMSDSERAKWEALVDDGVLDPDQCDMYDYMDLLEYEARRAAVTGLD